MKKSFRLYFLALLLPMCAAAQSDQHYTMFMYNKLLYNPGYAGSREVLSVNALYRNQWTGIPGAPKTINIAADAPVGSYMRPFRPVSAGVSVTNEKVGGENTTLLRTYYAYRIKMKQSTLSMGISAGANLYSANYSDLTLHQQNDPNFNANISNAILPAFGAGAYWSGSNFYCGLSVPSMLQNYYDKNQPTRTSQQIRAFYLSGGYVFTLNETIKLQPQLLARYAVNRNYQLPFSTDINLSAIAYDRLLLGCTYRTDKSVAFIAHMQATTRINIGYAYDHAMSALNGVAGGSHELVLGYDLIRDNSKFLTPRFIKKF
jgi:type IX secretion system PorP/SprF family membrane protein